MTVYVDQIRTYDMNQIKPPARRWGTRWCHMTADTLDELHAFAKKLGLSASYYQPHRLEMLCHYDLTPGRRQMAIKKGAVPRTLDELGHAVLMKLREEGNALQPSRID